MPHVVVTRNSQITLAKEVREKLGIKEGDVVTVNTLGEMAIVTKRDPAVWRRVEPFLPKDFDAALAKTRRDPTSRLKRLGLA